MNNIDFYDLEFRKTDTYINFINDNPDSANLNIRTSSFSEAIPVSGVNIIVSKILDNNKIVFFNGFTDDSGMINKIVLPTPKQVSNDLEIPKGTIYDINATYDKENYSKDYKVLMYSGICVVQNINIVPINNVSKEMDSDIIGS